jgi:hypothetical protein
LNGTPATPRSLEADSQSFSVRNTSTVSATNRSLLRQAVNPRRTKHPNRPHAPVAVLRSTSLSARRARSRPSSNNHEEQHSAGTLPASSETEILVSEKSTSSPSSSNEQQRSQHVGPTLENQR